MYMYTHSSCVSPSRLVIPWSWCSRRLWATWCGCWDSDLGLMEEQEVFLSSDPCLQPLLSKCWLGFLLVELRPSDPRLEALTVYSNPWWRDNDLTVEKRWNARRQDFLSSKRYIYILFSICPCACWGKNTKEGRILILRFLPCSLDTMTFTVSL